MLGAPNVAEFAPAPGSYLDVADFPDPPPSLARLRVLCADDAAYASFLRWKAEGLSPAFRAMAEAAGSDRSCASL